MIAVSCLCKNIANTWVSTNINMSIIGQTLGGHYYVFNSLGSGNFGETYLAKDIHLPGQPVRLLKRLQPGFSEPDKIKIAERLFDTEAKTLYKLGDNKQLEGLIPKLFAHFQENDEFYLVQEYIDGSDLSNEIYPDKQLSEQEVTKLLKEILEILAVVHQERVIHRDIKPSNLIRRASDGKIVLIDFGAVKQFSSQIKNAQGKIIKTVTVGTPGYMPVEQINGEPKLCSDIYAVGMLGIYALTGCPPDELPSDPKNLEIIWQDKVSVSPKLAKIINKMVRHNFNKRYQSAREVLRAFLPTTITEPTTQPPPPPPPVDQLRFKYLFAGLGFLAIAGLLWFSPASELLPQIFPTNPLAADKLTNTEIDKIARAITVRIISNDSSGSGVIINRQGQVYTVLTNKHVLLNNSNDYKILTADEKTHKAQLLTSKQFKKLDLALIQFSSSQSYQVVELGDSKQLLVGDKVYAVGFPNWQLSNNNKLQNTSDWGFKAFQVTTGKIDMFLEKMLLEGYQIGYTNDVIAGMSGGAVLDESGRLVAINGRLKHPIAGVDSFKFTDGTIPSDATFQKMENLSWAIPIDSNISIVDS